jgi:hypothetical protein
MGGTARMIPASISAWWQFAVSALIEIIANDRR